MLPSPRLIESSYSIGLVMLPAEEDPLAGQEEPAVAPGPGCPAPRRGPRPATRRRPGAGTRRPRSRAGSPGRNRPSAANAPTGACPTGDRPRPGAAGSLRAVTVVRQRRLDVRLRRIADRLGRRPDRATAGYSRRSGLVQTIRQFAVFLEEQPHLLIMLPRGTLQLLRELLVGLLHRTEPLREFLDGSLRRLRQGCRRPRHLRRRRVQ